jgi:hypothetical protein
MNTHSMHYIKWRLFAQLTAILKNNALDKLFRKVCKFLACYVLPIPEDNTF